MKLKLLAAGVCLAAFATLPVIAQQATLPSAQPQPPAAAESDMAPDRGRGPGRGALATCRSDLAAHCSGIERGRQARIACLHQNEAKLSDACRATIAMLGDGAGRDAGRRRGREDGPGGRRGDRAGGGPLSACRADLSTLCTSADRANGGRMRCLRDNQAKLSAECSQAIETLRSSRKSLRQACASERETICAKPGEGRGGLLGCLRENADRLSESCATTLAGMPGRGGIGRGRRGGVELDGPVQNGGVAPQPPSSTLR